MQSINKIKEYFVSMEMYEGRWVIAVKYRPKWGAYSKEDGRIKVSPDENEEDVWWYYASDQTVEVDEIIDFICETVATNIEAIKKVELFKMKASELKKIFSDESLSFKKLQTLNFVFDDSTTKNKSVNEDVKKKVISKKDLLTKIDDHDLFTKENESQVDDIVPEVKPKTKTRKKKDVEEKKVEETVEADEMTKEEIDELRG